MRALLASLAVLVACAVRVEPHTLDEYLQTTRLDITRNRIGVDLALTPGMAVASKVFATIDTDGDRHVSPQEIQAYARRVLQDLAVRVDGRPYSLTLTSAECPSWDEMRDGAAAIRLKASAEVPRLSSGRHRIHYENMHEPAAGAYLVNALLPATRAIAIAGQHRDARQHQIDVDVDVSTPFAAAFWLVLSVLALTIIRTRRPTRRTR